MHNRQLTFKQYRITDIIFLTALFTISEVVVTLAANKWFPEQPYVFSLSVLFIALFLMRWSLYAFIPAIVGAVAFCIASEALPEHYLIYTEGNLFALIPFLYLFFRGKEKVRKDPLKTAFFVTLIYIFMQFGRTFANICVGGSLSNFFLFLTTDSISLLFALVASILLRKTDGLFEDQKSYLLRTEKERNEKMRRLQ